MTFCRQCGAQLNEEDKFCSKCGTQQNRPINTEKTLKRTTNKSKAPFYVRLITFILIILGIVLFANLANNPSTSNNSSPPASTDATSSSDYPACTDSDAKDDFKDTFEDSPFAKTLNIKVIDILDQKEISKSQDGKELVCQATLLLNNDNKMVYKFTFSPALNGDNKIYIKGEPFLGSEDDSAPAPAAPQTPDDGAASSTPDSTPSKSISIPQQYLKPDEAAFLSVIDNEMDAYNNAPNDMVKGKVSKDMDDVICSALHSQTIKDWVGQVVGLGSSQFGNGVLSIAISNHVTISNNYGENVESSSFINSSSDLFKRVSSLQKGDLVRFSGKFYRGLYPELAGDCLATDGNVIGVNLTPIYLLKYTDVSKLTPSQGNLNTQAAAFEQSKTKFVTKTARLAKHNRVVSTSANSDKNSDEENNDSNDSDQSEDKTESDNTSKNSTSGDYDVAPAYLNHPPPEYPFVARQAGWQGRTVLEVNVGKDGRPLSVKVKQSSGHEVLDDAALQIVRDYWKFVPATKNGVNVEATGDVGINFSLTDPNSDNAPNDDSPNGSSSNSQSYHCEHPNTPDCPESWQAVPTSKDKKENNDSTMSETKHLEQTYLDYVNKIHNKIYSTWNPPDAPLNTTTSVHIILLVPSGAVISAKVVQPGSGNAQYDRSVEAAVLRASPLPVPPDQSLWNRFSDINLRFISGDSSDYSTSNLNSQTYH